MTCALAWCLYPHVGGWALRSKIADQLRARLGRNVTIAAVDVGRGGRALLRRVVISGANDRAQAPLATVESIAIQYEALSPFRGRVHLRSVALEGVRANLYRRGDGKDNYSDLTARLVRLNQRGKPRSAEGDPGSLGLRPDRVALRGGSFTFRDEAGGLTVVAGGLELEAQWAGAAALVVRELRIETTAGPAVHVGRVELTGELRRLRQTARVAVREGAVSLWGITPLSGIAGTLQEGDVPGRFHLDLSGGYGGAKDRLWRAGGWVDFAAAEASLRMEAERFTLDRISSVLADSAIVEHEQTSASWDLQVDVARGRAGFRGQFALFGLNLYHPMLAEETVRDVDLVVKSIAGHFEEKARFLQLDEIELQILGVTYRFSAYARLPQGIDPQTGLRRSAYQIGGELTVPKQPCQAILRGIPAQLVPYLQDVALEGDFEADIKVAIDFANLEATELSGLVALDQCEVTEVPEEINAERLVGSFTHYVEIEQDSWYALAIGPENPDFVAIDDVSPYLLNSLLTTEDSQFYNHSGFITSEFRTALIKDLEAGYYRYGASSITMQMVKNVLLYRQKTISRKLQELILSWYVERVLDKNRIFEIYVNAIEYGPGLYGIGAAARHYFGKHPRELNAVEAAFFSSILPAPKRRYRQYCDNRVWEWTERKIARILKHMFERNRLTAEEYAAASATPLRFDRNDALPARQCRLAVKRALENERPTDPARSSAAIRPLPPPAPKARKPARPRRARAERASPG